MIQKIDTAIFFFINKNMANPIFDFIMPLFDEPKTWIPFILFFWLLVAYKDKTNRKMLLILVPLIILFCDQIGGFIKDFGLGIQVESAGINLPKDLYITYFFSLLLVFLMIIERIYSNVKWDFSDFSFLIILRAHSSALVQEFIEIAYLDPINLENFFSNFILLGP